MDDVHAVDVDDVEAFALDQLEQINGTTLHAEEGVVFDEDLLHADLLERGNLCHDSVLGFHPEATDLA